MKFFGGQFQLYESSQESKKLRIYQQAHYFLIFPLLYCQQSNLIYFFSSGFKFVYIAKALLWSFPLSLVLVMRKNLKDNASTVAEKIFLMEDGMNIKVKRINRTEVVYPISQLKPMSVTDINKFIDNLQKINHQEALRFHKNFISVVVHSAINQNKVIDQFYMERQILDSIEEDNQQMLKCICNGINVMTPQFQRLWDREAQQTEQGKDLFSIFQNETAFDQQNQQIYIDVTDVSSEDVSQKRSSDIKIKKKVIPSLEDELKGDFYIKK